MLTQLTLGLKLRDDATFANFFAADNVNLMSSLQEFLSGRGEHFIYLWGQRGVGCSHLLQACCHELHAQDQSIFYLSLTQYQDLTPEILQNLATLDLICIDDIDVVLGKLEWEEALFHLYNQIRDKDGRLLVAAKHPPARLKCMLADLQSRLTWGLTFQVKNLKEQQIIYALQMRAQQRGLELSQEVARYLMRHFPRNMSALFAVLEKLDQASMVEQRRLTIPFVKKTLQI